MFENNNLPVLQSQMSNGMPHTTPSLYPYVILAFFFLVLPRKKEYILETHHSSLHVEGQANHSLVDIKNSASLSTSLTNSTNFTKCKKKKLRKKTRSQAEYTITRRQPEHHYHCIIFSSAARRVASAMLKNFHVLWRGR